MATHNGNPECILRLMQAGIVMDDAFTLRRIAMTLHRWHEYECGTENACIVRGKWNKETAQFDYDDNGAPHWEFSGGSGRSRYSRVPDREKGALKRLKTVMARYPQMRAYIQGDPRGASLYILRPGDVPEGREVDSCYSNGIAVYK